MPNNQKSQALILSEEQFRRAIEEAPIPTIMQAEDGQVLQISRSWTKLTGYELKDMQPFDNWLTNAVYDYAENVRNHMLKLFKGEKRSLNVEFPLCTVKGEVRHWSFSASSLGTLLDGRRFIVGMAVDITEKKKLDEDLKVNEEKYRSLFNSIDEGFCIIEVIFDANSKPIDYRFLEVNTVFEQQTGLAEAKGKLMRSLAPTHEDHWFRIYGEIAISGEPKHFEEQAKALNCYYEVYAFPIGKQTPYHVGVLFKDVSERKKTESALKESENLYHTIFNNSEDGFELFELIYDEKGQPVDQLYLQVNDAFVKQTGIKERNIIGKRAKEIFPNVESVWFEVPHTVLKTGKSSHTESYNQDTNRWYDVYFFPYAKNTVGGLFRDITEHKKLEDLIKQRSEQVSLERERFFNMLEDLPVMVCLITSDYKIPFANRLFRETFGEAKGKFCYEYVGCVNAPCEDCQSLIPLKTGNPHHWTAYFPNGTVVDAHDYPFIDKDGTKMILEADIDITERVNLQKKLQEKERLAAIGATAGMVGHDIRNPLQAIIGDVYLLKDYFSDMVETPIKRDAAESLEEIEKNIGYINKIVADLQDYSKQMTPQYSEVYFYELVINVFRSIAIPEDVSPSIDVEQSLILNTDPLLLQRILTNLIINAVQAMPKGGELEISAKATDSQVTVIVADTGLGIPEHVKPVIFTPMMTTKAKGQGLGLAVVKKFVEAMGGAITFESQEGKGTKFIIELPINQ